ncbi:hypothetical protein J4E91_007710 [Alternaria rosae]|nr:hypothetical protein J4E91_007710 [Alternaria rosae]
MDDFTIDFGNLLVPSLEEFPHLPPASDSPAQKRLYWFFRGLEEMTSTLYDRIEAYQDLWETLDEDEERELEKLEKELPVLLAAVNWAGRLYGGDEYEEGV